MLGVMLHAPGDVRVEEREDPRIVEPTDAILRVVATCVCGSDLWGYRGVKAPQHPVTMGHEYVGIVEEVGGEVTTLRVGQHVVGSFFTSCGVCEICLAGFQSRCIHTVGMGSMGAQAQYLRVPLADGTLVGLDEAPPAHLLPSLLTASDVLGTGWYGATAARVEPGKSVAVIGDGAVGLLATLAARELGAERIIVCSRNPQRQELAKTFGATDIVTERGDDAAAVIKELTGGYGAQSVVEAVGTNEAMHQAIRSARAGGHVGFLGVSHGVTLDGSELFYGAVSLEGGPAPVRRFLPDLIGRILREEINPGLVFDLTLPLTDATEGYAAMDERRAIKALLTP